MEGSQDLGEEAMEATLEVEAQEEGCRVVTAEVEVDSMAVLTEEAEERQEAELCRCSFDIGWIPRSQQRF